LSFIFSYFDPSFTGTRVCETIASGLAGFQRASYPTKKTPGRGDGFKDSVKV
jgi:hypothetical protein